MTGTPVHYGQRLCGPAIVPSPSMCRNPMMPAAVFINSEGSLGFGTQGRADILLAMSSSTSRGRRGRKEREEGEREQREGRERRERRDRGDSREREGREWEREEGERRDMIDSGERGETFLALASQLCGIT